ncbi:rubrerythrin family protein [Natronoarchaeum rubrum]|uniref:rubrerythrin family protein n=1 Tax=Natronoarchaeum rubrum TaxID=755311 RepID=UPI002111CC37|nr:rubrerythrin family protein [Natronoarchaeum rubrum]
MTATDILDDVRDDNETALSRLGSSKALYAITGGEMESETVLTAAADRAHAASETFAAWVPEEDDDDATEYYDAAAQLTADHYEQVLGKLDDHDPADVPAIQTQLRDADDTAARLGGLLGHTLVASKLVEQFTGFFVGDADPQTASLFRGYGGDVEDLREDVLDLIDDLDADDDAVAAAATDAIQAAYESYTDRLEDMGVNPKPVC